MPADILPRMLANRYRLERKLGHGGMGVVYAAVDTTMRRSVAIKLISPDPEVEDGVVERFMREAKNTARIRHPNIVHLFDLGRSQGELFFVMELLDGISLSKFMKQEQSVRQETAVHICRQICAALGYAHENGIIHRDLKPANVMLMRTPEEPHLTKVLDFGVAKAQDQGTQITRTGMLVGTVEYMSPEQIKGLPLDGRSDIYALGVILFRLLTGTQPFPDGSPTMVIQHQLKTLPRSLREVAPARNISPQLDALVLRCLAKRPDARFPSMADVDDALARALTDDDPYPSWQPTEVAPESIAYGPANAAPMPAETHRVLPTVAEGVEHTRVEGRSKRGTDLPRISPEVDVPQTLVMMGKPSLEPSAREPSLSPAFVERGHAIGVPSPTFAAPASVGEERLRVQPVYVLLATIVASGALGFAVLQGFDPRSIVFLGVGIIVATIILVLGTRKQ
jgi:serine/threonine protein kinase